MDILLICLRFLSDFGRCCLENSDNIIFGAAGSLIGSWILSKKSKNHSKHDGKSGSFKND